MSIVNVFKHTVRSFSTSIHAFSKLSGKTAVVTASSEGIGFAIAQKLGLDGAHVVISSRKLENVNNAVTSLKNDGISASGLVCHVGKKEDRKALLENVNEEHGGIDILVCNSGINPYFGKILDTPESSVDKIFDINVKATFMLVQEAVPLIQKRKAGSIVIVSSIAAYNSIDLLGIYSVSKTALVGLTKALTPELASMNIRVNCVAPGIIKTKFSSALWKNPDAEKVLVSQVPLGRVGEAHECSGIVSHLCSDEASYITGETIVVSGGMTSRL